jgi:lipoprotein
MKKKLLPFVALMTLVSTIGCNGPVGVPSDINSQTNDTTNVTEKPVETPTEPITTPKTEEESNVSSPVVSETTTEEESQSSQTEGPQEALWPADEIANYLVSMGIDGVTILPPTFNYTVTSYELTYFDGDGLIIYAHGGVDTVTYKDALVAAGWTVYNDASSEFYLYNEEKNCEIDLFKGYDNYTEIDIFPYVDTTLFPSESIAELMTTLGLGSVVIPEADASLELEYEINYYDGDDRFDVYMVGENCIDSYQVTLQNAGWEVHTNSLALTAFDPSDTVELFLSYSADDYMQTMTVKAKEKGSKTWPGEDLQKAFDTYKFNVQIPECNGFFYQLYLDDINIDNSIGIYVWTRERADYENYEKALVAAGWTGSMGEYEKENYRVQMMEDIEGTFGSIGIFVYAPTSTL